MAEHFELWTNAGSKLIALDKEQLTIGKATENDVVIDDLVVSRLHAVVARYPTGWAIRDMGSRNGTYVNSERIVGEQALRPGDEVRLGDTRLIYRAGVMLDTPNMTKAAQSAPELTRRERDVLVELCRPVLTGSLLTEPARAGDIAKALVVTESAVKKHIVRMYDKFGLSADGERRRGRLAGEAIRRGAVSVRDVRRPSE